MDILELMREHGYEHSGDYSNKVVKAEQDLGLSFAEDFREFLLTFGQTNIENHEITGVVLWRSDASGKRCQRFVCACRYRVRSGLDAGARRGAAVSFPGDVERSVRCVARRSGWWPACRAGGRYPEARRC